MDAGYQLLTQDPAGAADEDVRDEEERQRRGRVLRCAACRCEVTDGCARIEMGGAHNHTFVNPSGYAYHIGCFGVAPGTRSLGDISRWWSWFPGFAWRIAVCSGCREHLGWSFHGERTFFGLILDRLVEDDPEE